MAGVAIALLGVCGASPAAAAPLIASPGAGAVLTHSPVRVEVRAASTDRTRVLLGDGDVTSRLRATRGRLVGKLSPRNGLRYGRNKLVVVEGRGGNRIVKEARSSTCCGATTASCG